MVEKRQERREAMEKKGKKDGECPRVGRDLVMLTMERSLGDCPLKELTAH
jgi:hypothetical protein